MPRKKKEETGEEETNEATLAETKTGESNADDNPDNSEAAPVADGDVETEESTLKTTSGEAKEMSENSADAAADNEQHSILDSVLETVTSVAGTVASAVTEGVSSVVSAVSSLTDAEEEKGKTKSNRAEKVGVVASDKMTKTVTVRVDRVVKHPVYRKYIKRRKKFMAHDETGAAVGDKVRIVETRPLSARKRWRVVEIIQKAEK